MLIQDKHALLLLKNCWKERKVHLGFLSLLVALFSKLLHLLSELFSFTVAFFYNFHNFLPFLVDFVILPETQIKLEQWFPDVSGEEPVDQIRTFKKSTGRSSRIRDASLLL